MAKFTLKPWHLVPGAVLVLILLVVLVVVPPGNSNGTASPTPTPTPTSPRTSINPGAKALDAACNQWVCIAAS